MGKILNDEQKNEHSRKNKAGKQKQKSHNRCIINSVKLCINFLVMNVMLIWLDLGLSFCYLFSGFGSSDPPFLTSSELIHPSDPGLTSPHPALAWAVSHCPIHTSHTQAWSTPTPARWRLPSRSSVLQKLGEETLRHTAFLFTILYVLYSLPWIWISGRGHDKLSFDPRSPFCWQQSIFRASSSLNKRRRRMQMSGVTASSLGITAFPSRCLLDSSLTRYQRSLSPLPSGSNCDFSPAPSR